LVRREIITTFARNKNIYNFMERNEIVNRAQEVFRDVFDLDDLVINEEMVADDVEEWDSLSHIQLVVALEKAFSLKFTSREIMSWEKVGDLIDCIEKKV